MNSIIMNFDDNIDINIVYNQLKKQYPKIEISKKFDKDAAHELQEAMESEFKKLGIASEKEFMDWINGVIKETRRERRAENIV